jgi:DNA gyrase subunit B
MRSATEIRRRPGMYVGDLHDGSGLTCLLKEVLGNAIDLWFRGAVTRIDVSLRPGEAWVRDDGPGISTRPTESGVSFLEEVFTTFHDTPTADGHAPHLHLHLAGFGLVLVSALSSEVVVHTATPAGLVEQAFGRGVALGPPTARSGPAVGTTVRFVVDPEIFSNRFWDLPGIRRILRELVAFLPGLVISLQADGPGFHEAHTFGPCAGVHGLLGAELGLGEPLHAQVIRCHGAEGTLSCDLAMSWQRVDYVPDSRPRISSYCNALPTVGGVHVEGFERGLLRVLGAQWATRAKIDALLAGLQAVVSVMLVDPTFESPTRDLLANPAAGEWVERILVEQLPAQLAAEPGLLAALRARLDG